MRHGEAASWAEARIARLDLGTGLIQPWKVLRPDDPAGVTAVQVAYLTPDGEGYVYVYDRELSDLFLVEGLK